MHFQCSICHDSLLRPPEGSYSDAFECGPTAAAVLGCGHVFHDRCVRKWLHGKRKEDQRCPNCKKTCRPGKLYPLYLKTEDLQQGSSPPPEAPPLVNDNGEVDNLEALKLINSLYNRLGVQKEELEELAKAKKQLESALDAAITERDVAQLTAKVMEKDLMSKIVTQQDDKQRLQDKLDQTDLRLQAKIKSYKDDISKMRSELELCRQTGAVSQALAEAHSAIERQTVENRRHMSKEDLLTFVASIENKTLTMSHEHSQLKAKLQQARRIADQAVAQKSDLETQRWNLKQQNKKLEAEIAKLQSGLMADAQVVKSDSSDMLIPAEAPGSDDLEMRFSLPSLTSKKRKVAPEDSSSTLRRSSSLRIYDGLGGTKKAPFVRREPLKPVNVIDIDDDPPPRTMVDIRSLMRTKTSL